MTKTAKINFEESLQKLDVIANQMEQGNLDLEKSLENFAAGIALIRQCQSALEDAKQKVQILTAKSGQLNLEEYHSEG